MSRALEKRYEVLSPFELKNQLIRLAKSHAERIMLNAGRGNPNWVALEPRKAFVQLLRFALEQSERVALRSGFGGAPDKDGIAKRFVDFLGESAKQPGIDFLTNALACTRDVIKLDPDAFVGEMADAIIGDHYPEPDRILDCTAEIVRAYLVQEMFAGTPPPGKLDLFATEGGTAAMSYVFNSLMENGLLNKGDKIAIGAPIFTPYLEIPPLADYQLVEVELHQDEDNDWQYPDSEIEKLADPSVKAFFLVNPSNPPSVALHPDSLEKIAALIRTRRPDLILLTDDVYGTFVNGFKSLAAAATANTILVYSYSKYFGATGWRLGVIAIHQDNVLDKMIAALPEKEQAALNQRYSHVALEPEKMKLIERMVADSRAVALHHTAGLSTPQQVQMALFSLASLMDKKGDYKMATQDIVGKRYKALYDGLGIPCPNTPFDAHYYTTIDIVALARKRYGDDFAGWLIGEREPIDFVWRLANEKSIILMDGGGFDAPNMSVRVSLANLDDEAYTKIGQSTSDLLADYHNEWKGLK
ncbi:MAG: bifunctional aspartate transaminase/aspartate 4-decarboxylase [Coprothermobacterota bacterium]|nr:bifunctional aspartate transaminase/aspartate 4-decarboxylase [Coprothermobacterota bacterium]